MKGHVLGLKLCLEKESVSARSFRVQTPWLELKKIVSCSNKSHLSSVQVNFRLNFSFVSFAAWVFVLFSFSNGHLWKKTEVHCRNWPAAWCLTKQKTNIQRITLRHYSHTLCKIANTKRLQLPSITKRLWKHRIRRPESHPLCVSCDHNPLLPDTSTESGFPFPFTTLYTLPLRPFLRIIQNRNT